MCALRVSSDVCPTDADVQSVAAGGAAATVALDPRADTEAGAQGKGHGAARALGLGQRWPNSGEVTRARSLWRYTARTAADCLPYAFQLSLTNLCISCWPHDAPAWKMFEGLAPATRRLPIENRSLMINVASESQVLAISHLDTHNEQQTNINILLCMFGSKSFEHMSQ